MWYKGRGAPLAVHMKVAYEIIGYCATALTSAILVPHIYKVARTHQSEDLSYGMVGLGLAADVLWTAYAVNASVLPILVTSCIHATASITLITLKFVFDRRHRSIGL